jgi:hypothetical protein
VGEWPKGESRIGLCHQLFSLLFICPCRSVDFEKLTISLQLQVPLAFFQGKYEMSGKLAALPISGKGNFNSSLGMLYRQHYHQTAHTIRVICKLAFRLNGGLFPS